MDLEWFDDGLVFDCPDDLVVLSMEPSLYSRIWTPKLGVPDVKEPGSVELSGQTVVAFKVRTDGYIFIRSRIQLKLFCQLNFKNYPFDEQKCSVKLESRSLSDDNVILKWREDKPFRNAERFNIIGFRLSGYELTNDTVQVIDLFEDETVNRVIVTVSLTREWYHFWLDVYLPSALFVAMSWLSFWLEISAAPARITLGATTMLTLVTNSMTTRDKLPKVSYIHSLDMWIAFCTFMVFASLIEFALVSYLYRSEKTRQQRVKTLQRDLSALSLASLASSTDPLITVSKYLDISDMCSKNKLMAPDLVANLRRLSTATVSTTAHNLKKSLSKTDLSQSFMGRYLKIRCPYELADNIDR
ncbi:unnamed protein product, partial [Medioppia subpectinata]